MSNQKLNQGTWDITDTTGKFGAGFFTKNGVPLHFPIKDTFDNDADKAQILTIASSDGAATFELNFDVSNTGVTSGQFSVSNASGATKNLVVRYNTVYLGDASSLAIQSGADSQATVTAGSTVYLTDSSGGVDNALNLAVANTSLRHVVTLTFQSPDEKYILAFEGQNGLTNVNLIGHYNATEGGVSLSAAAYYASMKTHINAKNISFQKKAVLLKKLRQVSTVKKLSALPVKLAKKKGKKKVSSKKILTNVKGA